MAASTAAAAADTETKAGKFKRLAESRVSATIIAVRKIGGLANKSQYDYTTEQTDKIFAAIDKEVAAVKAAFTEGKAKAEAGFSL